MRLTNILNSVLGSNGGEIVIGSTTIDGVNVNFEEDGSFTLSTLTSDLASSKLRITSSRSSGTPGEPITVVATTDVEYDSYSWALSGDASFVSGVSEGKIVQITSDVVGENIITLTATKDGVDMIREAAFFYVTGVFSSPEIVGVNLIDDDAHTTMIINTIVTPDTVDWSISGGGDIVAETNPIEATVIPNSSGDDIIVSATLNKAGYESFSIDKAIAVDKAAVGTGGSAGPIEKPYIIEPRNEVIKDSGEVIVGDFVGDNFSSALKFQVSLASDSFASPIIDSEIAYSTSFGIDTLSLINGESYIMRVRFTDNLGNNSDWSDVASFVMYEESSPSYIENISHYWAMNTQDPIDHISGRNGITHSCTIDSNGFFDNAVRLNGSSSRVFIPDFNHAISDYSIGIMFETDVERTSYQVVCMIEQEGVNLFYVAIQNGVLSINNNSANIEVDILPLTRYILTVSADDIVLNGVSIGSFGGVLASIPNGAELHFGAEANDTLTGYKNQFDGIIEEAAFWEYGITSQNMVDWHTKEERPFGKDGTDVLPYTAIDQPYILSSKGSDILVSPYFGLRDFDYVEYSIAEDTALDFNSPIVQTIYPNSERIPIAQSIPNDNYKVRVRYIDVNGNKSLWSQTVVFKREGVLDLLGDGSCVSYVYTDGDVYSVPDEWTSNTLDEFVTSPLKYVSLTAGDWISKPLDTSIYDNFAFSMWVKPRSTIVQTSQSPTGVSGTSGQKWALVPNNGGVDCGVGLSVGTNCISVFEHGNSYLPSVLVHPTTTNGLIHVIVNYTNRVPSLYIMGVKVRTGVEGVHGKHIAPNIIGSGTYGEPDMIFNHGRLFNRSLADAEAMIVYNAEKLI